MTIEASSVLIGATPGAFTGGTSYDLTIIDPNKNGAVEALVDDGADFDLRKTVDFRVTQPRVSKSAPTGWTKRRRSFTEHNPRLCDDGVTRDVDTMKTELSASIELSAAEIWEMRVRHAQYILSSEMDAFFNDGAKT